MGWGDEMFDKPTTADGARRQAIGATRPGGRRRAAPVSLSGAGRGRASGKKIPMYGWGFGHGGAPGAAKAQWDAHVNLNNQLGDPSVDPFGGSQNNILDLLAGIDDGSSNRNGGGGGAGAAAAAAAKVNAQKAYAMMNDALAAKLAAGNQGFDARVKNVNELGVSNQKHVNDILAGLGAAGAATRADVQGVYQGGDARLSQLASEIQQAEAMRAQGANQTLGMFGAGNDAFTRQYGAQDLVNAQRVALGGMQTADDRMFAQRGDVYAGLGADARLNQANSQNTLLQQIAAARQAAAAQAAAEKAQIAIQAAQDGVKL